MDKIYIKQHTDKTFGGYWLDTMRCVHDDEASCRMMLAAIIGGAIALPINPKDIRKAV